MASSSPSSRSGSRAIKIPKPEHVNDYPPTGHRRRRGGRCTRGTGSVDSSDADPSSLGSDQDSSWPDSPAPGMRSIASPATHLSKDPRLPTTAQSSDSFSDSSSSQRKDKAPVHSSTSLPSAAPNPMLSSSPSPLGPSMLLSTSYKSINLNDHHGHHSYDPDEPPRLITYTTSGQGFTWNEELFLPSYLVGRQGRRKTYDGDFGDEETCPVTEIFISEEEAAN